MKASLTVIYWRDIPAQIIAHAGRRSARRALSERFQAAIDRAAMRAGLAGSDDYLGEWRRAEPLACGGDLEAEADALAARLEAAFTDDVLSRYATAGGRLDREAPQAPAASADPLAANRREA